MSGLVAGALCGLLSGALITRFRGLPQLVLSIAIGQLVGALSNKLSSLTGGSDGLSGITPAPVLGVFAFDMYSRTAYIFSVVVLGLVFAVLLRFVRSPFGLLCRGIRDDDLRARMIGASVYPRLIVMYGVSGAVAGVGGALMAITTGVVGLDSVSFERSAEVLVMLVLGGAGGLWGALTGAIIFQIFEHIVSATNPFHWMTLVGLLLILIVVFMPRGLAHGAQTAWSKFRMRGGKAMSTLLELQGLSKAFGGLHVNRDISFSLASGDRVALIGPNGAGKTTLVNVMSGDLPPSSGRIVFDGEDVTRLPIARRVRRGLVRTFQITRLFTSLTAEENVALAVMQRRKMTRRFLSLAADAADVRGNAKICCGCSASIIWRDCRWCSWPTASSVCWSWRSVWRSIPKCCCSTSRRPACRMMKRRAFWRRSIGCRRTSPC